MADGNPESGDGKVRYRARRTREREPRVAFSVKLRPALKEDIERLAVESGMSRNAYIEDVLTVAVIRGWVKPPDRVEEPRFEERKRRQD